MGAEADKLVWIICASVLLVIIMHIVGSEQSNGSTQKPISLPEEIGAVKPGDTLVVTKVSDSIYIQFK